MGRCVVIVFVFSWVMKWEVVECLKWFLSMICVLFFVILSGGIECMLSSIVMLWWVCVVVSVLLIVV